jgi:hypothetical protein
MSIRPRSRIDGDGDGDDQADPVAQSCLITSLFDMARERRVALKGCSLSFLVRLLYLKRRGKFPDSGLFCFSEYFGGRNMRSVCSPVSPTW